MLPLRLQPFFRGEARDAALAHNKVHGTLLSMQATSLRLRGGVLRLEVHTIPLAKASDVVVALEAAGVCRTDLAVIAGAIPVADGRTPGHEGCGRVVSAGPGAEEWLSRRVTLLPSVEDARFGIDRDGAFTDHIVAPVSALVPLPEQLSSLRGAFVEPVAATLGALAAAPPKSERGVIVGSGRIAELTFRVLKAAGYDVCCDTDPAENRFAWGIDATLAGEALLRLCRAVRPGGLVILKSRCEASVPLPLTLCQRKELVLRPVGWGPFARAIALLEDPTFAVEGRFGDPAPLSDYSLLFERSRDEDGKKEFFRLSTEFR
jgi:hypothetical protein